ncbi:MAG TPA: hypothetical protein VKP66_17390 [Steroidobacteraceae bacterium]|nr:hypothetical protein [Steroidobacteraceae bacterium]
MIAGVDGGAVDTAVNIVKLSGLTVNQTPLLNLNLRGRNQLHFQIDGVLHHFSSRLVEFELKALTGVLGRDTRSGS